MYARIIYQRNPTVGTDRDFVIWLYDFRVFSSALFDRVSQPVLGKSTATSIVLAINWSIKHKANSIRNRIHSVPYLLQLMGSNNWFSVFNFEFVSADKEV